MSADAVVVLYGYAMNDPVCRHVTEDLLSDNCRVTVVQLPPVNTFKSPPVTGADIVNVALPSIALPSKVFRLARWFRFRAAVQRVLRNERPRVVIPIMFHAVAAVASTTTCPRMAACVYDIPSKPDAGVLDGYITKKAWKALLKADVLWSSDEHKAALVSRATSRKDVAVVHNCPRLGEQSGNPDARDGWLRAELRRDNVAVSEDSLLIVRAGAIGPHGGIEATVDAIREVPGAIFVMMGRPDERFALTVEERAREAGVGNRVVLWKRTSDERWSKALAGADLGHLIHERPAEGPARRAYDLNSSLSNYRLFRYMAAALPIISHLDPRLEQIYASVDCFDVISDEGMRGQLTARLLRLARDPQLRAERGRAAQAAHLNLYNWERQFSSVRRRLRDLPSEVSQ